MSASANKKCKFADLKYEQMIGKKYLVETCFSKKYTSNPPEQVLQDLRFQIKSK